MPLFSRPVLLLLGGLFLMSVAMAVLNTLVPLWLTHADNTTFQVGMVSSAYYAGNLCGTLIAGLLIYYAGFNASYYISCVLFTLSAVGLLVSTELVNWIVWRFSAGIACSIIWVVVESAMLHNGTLKTRGVLLVAYMAVYFFGTVIGQLSLTFVSTLIEQIFRWILPLMIAAILPLLFTQIARPVREQQTGSLWHMLSLPQARLGVIGCVVSGVILGVLYGLLPVYFAHQGLSDAKVAQWMAVVVISGVIGQYPVGKLTVKYPHLTLLKGQTLLTIIAGILISQELFVTPSLIVLGAASFTLYPITMVWACEQVKTAELVAMNQALLLSYTLGSLLGPMVVGYLMLHSTDHILFVAVTCAACIYGALLLCHTVRERSLYNE